MLTRARANHLGHAAAMDRVRLQAAAGVGVPPSDDLPARCRRAVAVARAMGAPLLDAIDGAQAAHDDQMQAERAVRVASAQTRTVAAGLLLAPLLLVPGLGRLVGADLVGFYTSGIGMVVLVVALVLLTLGASMIVLLVRRVGRSVGTRRSSRATPAAFAAVVAGVVAWRMITPVVAPLIALFVHHLVDRGRRPDPVPDIDEAIDLTATALSGGVSAPAALRAAADHLPALATRLRRVAFGIELGMGAQTPAPEGLDRLVTVLVTAEEVGAPLAPTLRRLARDVRADDLARVLAAAERLPAQLTFPTALALLPATVLLVGAPIVHAGLGAVGL